MTPNETHMAYRVSIKGMFINLLLFIAKGTLGLLIHSTSLLSDAVHSLSDIISTLVVLLGIKLSSQPTDKEHPYGHDKFECIIAFLLGIMLFVIGSTIAWEGIQKFWQPKSAEYAGTTLRIFAIAAAAVSILAKEWMYRFTMTCSRLIRSASMAADAWHHRTDAFSSVGSLVGVIGICVGFPLVDAAACIIISGFIYKAAYDICADACSKLVDSSGNPDIIYRIEQVVKRNNEVLSIDIIKTRQFGSKLYVDLEITLDHNITFEHSHQVAHYLHDNIESTISDVKHCMIHVNPSA